MVKKDSKFALSMTYGPREDALLRDIEKISKSQEFDISRNEVLRRGLYAFKNLVDVDEQIYLKLLSHTLHLLKENIDLDTLRFAKDTASQILTLLIIKYGLAKADSFETVLDSLETIYGILSTQKLDKTYDEKIKNEISDLATSLDTIFLNSEKDSQKLSSIINSLQLLRIQKSKHDLEMNVEKIRDIVNDSRNIFESKLFLDKPFKGEIGWFDNKWKLGVLESIQKYDLLISPIGPSAFESDGIFDIVSYLEFSKLNASTNRKKDFEDESLNSQNFR